MLSVLPNGHSLEFEYTVGFGSSITKTITLKNNVEESVAYKIKTTAPTIYNVKPSIGVIPPNESHEISITFRPSHLEDPANGHKRQDRFRIQCSPLPAECNNTLPLDFWNKKTDEDFEIHKLSVLLINSFANQGANNASNAANNAGGSASNANETAILSRQVNDLYDRVRKIENLQRSLHDTQSKLIHHNKKNLLPLWQIVAIVIAVFFITKAVHFLNVL